MQRVLLHELLKHAHVYTIITPIYYKTIQHVQQFTSNFDLKDLF